jgi:hypothetical protein
MYQQALREKETRNETQFPTKIGAKTSLCTSFCKISFQLKHLMPYYAKTGRSRPLIT